MMEIKFTTNCYKELNFLQINELNFTFEKHLKSAS